MTLWHRLSARNTRTPCWNFRFHTQQLFDTCAAHDAAGSIWIASCVEKSFHGPQCHCSTAKCTLDVLGDHRSACPTTGVLGPRGAPLERAAVRVCREAGARVASNVFLRNMNIGLPLADCRRVEVLANGLPLWQGAQVAVDTTSVCLVSRYETARPGAAQAPGSAAQQAARRKRWKVYSELVAAQRCKLVVLGFECGGRMDAEAFGFIRRLKARASLPPSLNFNAGAVCPQDAATTLDCSIRPPCT